MNIQITSKLKDGTVTTIHSDKNDVYATAVLTLKAVLDNQCESLEIVNLDLKEANARAINVGPGQQG